MLKGYKYRIYPNKQQEEQIQKTFGCCRFVYNQTLAYRDEIIQMIINEIIKLSNTKPYFFKIYEGNKSGVGKQTKKDCWQRNQKTKDYLQQFDFAGIYAPIVYKGFITNEKGKELLK